MQPATLPPWLSPWSTGLLYGQRMYKGALRERYRPRDRHRPRLTIYTYNHDDSHILRIGGWSTITARPMLGAAGWERFPARDHDPWQLAAPALSPHIYPQINMKYETEASDPPLGAGAGTVPAGGTVAGGPGGTGGTAWVGWVAGTALLALFVLLARATERCIDKRFFKRRRRSEEWPTPSVFATSHQQSINDGVLRPGIESGELPGAMTVDLPPPYTECSPPQPGNTAPKLTDYPEEPPPPYSDCFVEFSNKNGIPSVLIFSRQRNSILNRHEIVGGRSVDGQTEGDVDDTGAVILEEVRIGESSVQSNIVTPQPNEENPQPGPSNNNTFQAEATRTEVVARNETGVQIV